MSSMKFYELPQATQDMLVERQRDYVTSCMDWLEDLFPLINDRERQINCIGQYKKQGAVKSPL